MRKFKVKVNGKEYEVEIEEIKIEEKADEKEDKNEEPEKTDE